MSIIRKERPEPDPKTGKHYSDDFIRCDICGNEQRTGSSGWWTVSRNWQDEMDLCRLNCFEVYIERQRAEVAEYHLPECADSDIIHPHWDCRVPALAGAS